MGEGQVWSDKIPDLTQVSGKRSKFEAASPCTVPWLSELKLCREMGTHPGGVTAHVWTWYPYSQDQGLLKMWFQGPYSPLHVWLAQVWMMRWAWAVGLGFTGGLELAAGVENASGEGRYPYNSLITF